MGATLVMIWILQLFPAQPMLAPIMRTSSAWCRRRFPFLLVAPALVIDYAINRMPAAAGRVRQYLFTIAAGIAAMAALGVVQWYFAEFLLTASTPGTSSSPATCGATMPPRDPSSTNSGAGRSPWGMRAGSPWSPRRHPSPASGRATGWPGSAGSVRVQFITLALVAAAAVTAAAHVGTSNAYFEGVAGPYGIRVIVRTPGVIPGLAQASVRILSGGDVERVTVRPLRSDVGLDGAPPPDVAGPVRGEPDLYSGEL